MKNRIAIALAPTGGWGEGDNNPVTPEAISAEVIACARSGASILHLHARDRYGRLTADLVPYDQAVTRIKEHCDIILEASTGEVLGASWTGLSAALAPALPGLPGLPPSPGFL